MLIHFSPCAVSAFIQWNVFGGSNEFNFIITRPDPTNEKHILEITNPINVTKLGPRRAWRWEMQTLLTILRTLNSVAFALAEVPAPTHREDNLKQKMIDGHDFN